MQEINEISPFPLVGKRIRRELYPDHEFGGFSAMLKEHGVQLYSSDVIPAIELIFWSEDGNRLELGHNIGGNFVRNSFETKNQ